MTRTKTPFTDRCEGELCPDESHGCGGHLFIRSSRFDNAHVIQTVYLECSECGGHWKYHLNYSLPRLR